MNAAKRSLLVLTLAAAAGIAVLVGLGTWQLSRLSWKEQLLAQMAERAERVPVSLDQALALQAGGEDVRFLRVRLSGSFRNDLERHFYTVADGAPAWRIITPLRTSGGLWVMVDRGTVPAHLKDAGLRAESVTDTEVSFTAQLREAGEQGWFVPDNDVAANEWYWRDLDAMAAGLDETAVPFFAEAVEPTSEASLPAPAPLAFSSLPNKHLEYAITWFALAGTLLAVYSALAWTLARSARRTN